MQPQRKITNEEKIQKRRRAHRRIPGTSPGRRASKATKGTGKAYLRITRMGRRFPRDITMEKMDVFLRKNTFSGQSKKLLDQGIPVVLSIPQDLKEEFNEGEMLKIYPDGRRELIALDEEHKEITIRSL